MRWSPDLPVTVSFRATGRAEGPRGGTDSGTRDTCVDSGDMGHLELLSPPRPPPSAPVCALDPRTPARQVHPPRTPDVTFLPTQPKWPRELTRTHSFCYATTSLSRGGRSLGPGNTAREADVPERDKAQEWSTLGAHAVAPSASVPPSPVLLCGVCRLAFGYGASGGVTPGEEPPRRWGPLRGEGQREAAATRKVSGADGAVTCHLRTPVPPQAPSIPPAPDRPPLSSP